MMMDLLRNDLCRFAKRVLNEGVSGGKMGGGQECCELWVCCTVSLAIPRNGLGKVCEVGGWSDCGATALPTRTACMCSLKLYLSTWMGLIFTWAGPAMVQEGWPVFLSAASCV